MADDEEASGLLKKFMVDVMGHIVESVGWTAKEGEHHTRGLLRMLIISRMGQLGHPATVAEVRRRFAAHASGAEKIPADLRAPVYNAYNDRRAPKEKRARYPIFSARYIGNLSHGDLLSCTVGAVHLPLPGGPSACLSPLCV